jgi:hypothetical protein
MSAAHFGSLRGGLSAALGLLLGLGTAARAEEPLRSESPGVELERAATPDRFTAEQRPFAWVVDPSTVERGHASLSYGLGMASGQAPDRPVPIEIAPSATSHQVSASYGITDRFAPFATATMVQGQGTSFAGGAKLQLTSTDAPFRLAVLGAAIHEGASGAGGGWVRVAGSWDQARLRLGATVHAEKVFAPGRDAIDVMAMAGASYRVLRDVRLGVEYVGQDFEAEDAEGGARHVVGPNLAVDIDRGRFQLVVAGGFGLSERSPHAIVRAGLAGAF